MNFFFKILKKQAFRLMSLSELRKNQFFKIRGRAYDYEDEPDGFQKPSFWDRLFFVLNLREENNLLRAKLLATIRSAEDAGRMGLLLYEDNEKLKKFISFKEEPDVFNRRFVPREQLEQAEIEAKKWEKIAFDWDQRFHDTFDEYLKDKTNEQSTLCDASRG